MAVRVGDRPVVIVFPFADIEDVFAGFEGFVDRG